MATPQQDAPSVCIQPVAHPVAVVNGVAIDAMELQLVSPPGGRGDKASAEDLQKRLLEAIISDELILQKARAMGLDSNPKYLAATAKDAARYRFAQRQAMLQVFEETEVASQSKISDQEALDFFNQNAATIKTEFRVMQIFYKRKPKEAAEVLAELNRGVPFEDVARRQYPGLEGSDKKPWDLGFMGWDQIPESWLPVLNALQVGSHSDVVTGEKDRYWILKLADKRTAQDRSFETEKPSIKTILQRKKTADVRASIESQLRRDATIEYLPLPPAPDDE